MGEKDKVKGRGGTCEVSERGGVCKVSLRLKQWV